MFSSFLIAGSCRASYLMTGLLIFGIAGWYLFGEVLRCSNGFCMVLCCVLGDDVVFGLT